MTLSVALVSPEKILFEGEARIVSARTIEGEIAFLTGHAPFIGALGIGTVVIGLESGEDAKAAVHGGFVEVKDNRVTILSDVAELADQIDVNRAQEAKSKAEAALREQQDGENEAALRRANVRLELAQR